MTLEQAIEEVNNLVFPFAEEGDIVEYEGYSFVYNSGQWEQSDGTN